MSATPRPWRAVGTTVQAGERKTSSHVVVADSVDFNLTEEEREANAAFIVAAVNAHDALVEALRGLLDVTERGNMNAAEYERARAALKLVEGKP